MTRRPLRSRLAAVALEDRTVPAAPVPAGTEFLVNTTTAGVQATTIFPHNYVVVENLNAVASDGQGNTVAVWGGNGPGDADGIFAQRYDAAGNALDTETRLNTTTAGVQNSPVVARASSAGSYAAAWDNGYAVSARVYNADGAAVTGELVVAAASSSTKNYVASIAMDASGDFAVMYKQTVRKGFSDTHYFYAQRYNAAGQAQGKAIKVATPTLINGRAGVGMDAAGGFVVAWDQDASNIYAQRYDSGGRAVGSRVTANEGLTAGTNWESNVAMGAAGDFVITWFNMQNPVFQQYAQAFTATGTPRGPAFTFGAPTEIPTSIAVEGNGDFILAWATDYPSFSPGDADILAQRFTANSVAKEAAIVVNTTLVGDQVNPSVAADGTGGFVVVWNTPVLQNNAPATDTLLDCDVSGQRFVIPPDPLTAAAAPAAPAASGTVTAEQIAPLRDEAVRRWALAGEDAARLAAVAVRVGDLPGLELGRAQGSTVTLDADAAGWGWFTDPTPRGDGEFLAPGDQGERGRMDLLTVLMHEYGHVLRLDHDDGGVMAETLVPGVREAPLGVASPPRPAVYVAADWSSPMTDRAVSPTTPLSVAPPVRPPVRPDVEPFGLDGVFVG